MVARATRRHRAGAKAKHHNVLKVDSASKIAGLKKMLGNGRLTVVLVYADWCGACTRFKKSIWGPMSQRPAVHNRVAIREDLVGQTPLAGSKYKYLPTIMVVDEAGKPQQVESPEGPTNAVPTPRSLDEMKRIVNLNVTPSAAAASATDEGEEEAEEEEEDEDELEPTPGATPATSALGKRTLEPMTMTPPPLTKSKTPEGIVYTPYPPAAAQRGGGLLSALEVVANVALPAAALGTAAVLARKRSTKRRTKRSTKKRSTKRT